MNRETVIQKLVVILNDGNKNNSFNDKFYTMVYELPEDERESVFQYFLLNNEHYEHEEIAGVFQRTYNQNNKNADLLIRAISSVPKYLEIPDLKYSYIRKCIYAIGAQPNPTNINMLRTLCRNEDLEISKLAQHQLNKRIELGRWEFDKLNAK